MKIEIWGTLPPPIGGVSIHLNRLYNNLLKLNKYNLIFKNFNGNLNDKSKNIFSVRYKLLEFLKLPFVSKRLYHIHSSNIVAWLFIVLLAHKHKIIITIHNKKNIREGSIIKFFIRKCFLTKVKAILINDFNYGMDLSEKYNISINKFIETEAYIPPLESEYIGLDKTILKFINSKNKIISANAYKINLDGNNNDVYRFDILIKLIYELKLKKYNVGLIYCLPQIGNSKRFEQYKKDINQYNLFDDILIINSNITNAFEIWGKSDIFIRPTLTDIEAISVKEALFMGTQVLATNVCVRPKEVTLYNGSFSELLEKTIYILNNSNKVYYTNSGALKNITKIYNEVLKGNYINCEANNTKS